MPFLLLATVLLRGGRRRVDVSSGNYANPRRRRTRSVHVFAWMIVYLSIPPRPAALVVARVCLCVRSGGCLAMSTPRSLSHSPPVYVVSRFSVYLCAFPRALSHRRPVYVIGCCAFAACVCDKLYCVLSMWISPVRCRTICLSVWVPTNRRRTLGRSLKNSSVN